MSYDPRMKTITVRLPDRIAASIENESRKRRVTKSEVVRERLQAVAPSALRNTALDDISHLIGSVEDDLPADLSARKKHYLRVTGYGRNRNR